MKRFSASALFLIVPLALFGAGCFKQKTPVTTPTAAPSQASTPKVAIPREPTDKELRAELKDAIKRFVEAKSFRANVAATTAEGEVKANISVAKPNRFHGIVQSGATSTLDMIIVDQTIYLKPNNTRWIKLKASADTKDIADVFKKAFSGNPSLESMGLDETAPIKKTHSNSQNCDAYKTQFKQPDGSLQDVTICVRDGLPTSLDTKTKDGPLKVNYYDINAVFLIEKPM